MLRTMGTLTRDRHTQDATKKVDRTGGAEPSLDHMEVNLASVPGSSRIWGLVVLSALGALRHQSAHLLTSCTSLQNLLVSLLRGLHLCRCNRPQLCYFFEHWLAKTYFFHGCLQCFKLCIGIHDLKFGIVSVVRDGFVGLA